MYKYDGNELEIGVQVLYPVRECEEEDEEGRLVCIEL